MYKVYLENRTKRPIFVTGCAGKHWGTSVVTNGIAPGKFAKVGEMSGPTSGLDDHFGWIFVALHGSNQPCLQLYVAAGTVRGLFDYCVQYYDGGQNRRGDTIVGTTVELKQDGVALSIDHAFDPWMTQIPDTRMLHQITIPGTHDSGTKGLPAPSECQSTTIDEQLHMGVRYFDVRVDASVAGNRIVHGNIHGSGNTTYYFREVADMFARFLTGQTGCPSTKETVILQVKADRGSDAGLHAGILMDLRAAFAGHEDLLYLAPIRMNNAAIPKIGELRGHLVLIRRYGVANEDASDSATPVMCFSSGLTYNAWSQNPAGQKWEDAFALSWFEWPDGDDNKSYFGGKLIDYRNRHGLSFVIQDRYKDGAADKWSHLLDYLRAAKQGASADSWFLNFASCTPPESTSNAVNPHLMAFGEMKPEPPSGEYGTILMDYVTPDLVRTIIDLNF